LLKLVADKNLPNAQHEYALSLLTTNGKILPDLKEEFLKYLSKANDRNYIPSMYLLDKFYYNEEKHLLKKASKLGSNEATEL
ncbi:21807_t:CDS:1, partial [Dentiscutata erythropus]